MDDIDVARGSGKTKRRCELDATLPTEHVDAATRIELSGQINSATRDADGYSMSVGDRAVRQLHEHSLRATDTQGRTPMGNSLACQSLVINLLPTRAPRATTLRITKVEWNSRRADVGTAIVATTIGGVISFLASIVAIPGAGIG